MKISSWGGGGVLVRCGMVGRWCCGLGTDESLSRRASDLRCAGRQDVYHKELLVEGSEEKRKSWR